MIHQRELSVEYGETVYQRERYMITISGHIAGSTQYCRISKDVKNGFIASL